MVRLVENCRARLLVWNDHVQLSSCFACEHTVGQGTGELKAPHNDTRNLRDYLVNVCGFDPSQMLILMDDGEHPMPTRKNIEAGLERLVRYSQPGDVVFFSFSGHGGQAQDTSGKHQTA